MDSNLSVKQVCLLVFENYQRTSIGPYVIQIIRLVLVISTLDQIMISMKISWQFQTINMI